MRCSCSSTRPRCASCRSSRRETWTPAGLAAVALALTGCGENRVEVRAGEGHDFGHGELIAAAERVGASPDSPAAYRAFALEVERLRPQFSAEVAHEAERSLVFLALRPLQSAEGLLPAEQLERLALTVWPTALEVAPRPGETPHAYVERT